MFEVARSRRSATVLTALVAAAVVLALTPGRTWAHSQLVGSTPADGSVWSSPPASAQLDFSAQVDPALARVSVAAPDGTVTTVKPLVQDRRVTVPLPGSTSAGGYEVRYRVVSTDGHPVAGQVAFRVQAASGTGQAVVVSSPLTEAPPTSSLSGLWPALVVVLLVLAGVGALAARRRSRAT